MIMEAACDGGFDQDFGGSGLATEEVKAIGSLLGRLHLLDTRVVESAANAARELVERNFEQCGVSRVELDQLWRERGGFAMLTLWWWTVAFPKYLALRNSSLLSMAPEYNKRVRSLLIDTLSLSPKSKALGKIGFTHSDLFSGNILKRGKEILAIDFEASTTGPRFLDLGGFLFLWRGHFEGMEEYQDMTGNRKFRTELAKAYFGTLGETEEMTEEVLFDLEIGFLHRFVYELIWKHIVDLQLEEELVGKAELMLKALQAGQRNLEARCRLVECGVFLYVKTQELSLREQK